MRIENHLPHKSIRVVTDSGQVDIPAQTSRDVHISPPEVIKVYVSLKRDSRYREDDRNDSQLLLFRTLRLGAHTNPNATLSIGKVVSRIDPDYYSPPAYVGLANQGLPRVRVHNESEAQIDFENGISVAPGEVVTYNGQQHFGVPYGTIFNDKRHIHPTHTVTQVMTDLYFGTLVYR